VAKQFLDLGFYIGIGGAVTFKNARKLPDVVAMCPMDCIVIETDCPYMAPVPFRGKRNDSSYLTYVCSRIAEIKNLSAAEVERITEANARAVYGIS
jgi:TatD DNase family protein